MVEDSGFEPDSWDSKSQVQTNIPILNKLVSQMRFELMTFPFQAEHATRLRYWLSNGRPEAIRTPDSEIKSFVL